VPGDLRTERSTSRAKTRIFALRSPDLWTKPFSTDLESTWGRGAHDGVS